MDLGLVSFDGFVGLETSTKTSTDFSSENATEAKNRRHGSGFLKEQSHASYTVNPDDYRDLKVAKTYNKDYYLAAASREKLIHPTIPFSGSNSCNFSQGQQMLSFSSPNSQTLPFYPQTSCAFGKNPGLNAGGMHGVRLTPSQWMELEHQAIIYEYIAANAPIPSYLLNPIRKALQSAVCSTIPGLRPNALGWGGAFHLGFSNTDPEPGRCRRTDGKKWRCAKDAVADQKYCERHMNRGRHRSRKPVEGQPGSSVTGATTTVTDKLTPVASSTSASVVAGGGISNSFGLSHDHDHHHNNYQLGSSNSLSATPQINRNFFDKEIADKGYQNTMSQSMLSSASNLKDNQSSVAEQQNPYKETSQSDFRLLCSSSLLNPMNESSFLVNCRKYGMINNLNDKESRSPHRFCPIMDDWAKNQTDPSAISWADVRTQLSMSMPMATSDSSSPTNEKLAISSLRMSRELEAMQMGLGVGILASEQSQRQMNWIPIMGDCSGGGPLGEVLNSTNNSTGDSKSTTALELMKEGGYSSGLSVSSPTEVSQRVAFGSVCNSSAGD